MSYKLTRRAQADLASLVDFSRRRFGSEVAFRYVDKLERALLALDRGDFEGPALKIGSRARPVRRWPVPPHWLYYERVGGVLRILRIYHDAREPL